MRRVLFSIFFFGFSLSLCSQTLADYRFITNEFYPNAYMEKGILKGAGVELLAEIWKQAKISPQTINLYPFARTLDIVQTEVHSIAFAITRNEQREPLFKWAGPILSSSISLIGMTEKNFKFKTFNDVRNLRIGVVNKDIGEGILEANKYPKSLIEHVSSLDELSSMLNYGRIDLVCVNNAAFFSKSDQNDNLKTVFKNFLTVSETKAYFVFNKNAPDADVKALQKILDQIEVKRQEIMAKYGLAPR